MDIVSTFLKGFLASGGLIMAIGAQNAFVIRQGITGQYLFLTAFLCSLLDAILITLGVLGFGALLDKIPALLYGAKYFAIIYLLIYGALSFKSALADKNSLSSDKNGLSLKRTIFFILTLTLLNPHAYLDTVLLLGSIASQEMSHLQMFFAIGAISASFLWFFSLTYLSRGLAPKLNSPKAIKILDIVVGMIMWTIALILVINMLFG